MWLEKLKVHGAEERHLEIGVEAKLGGLGEVRSGVKILGDSDQIERSIDNLLYVFIKIIYIICNIYTKESMEYM